MATQFFDEKLLLQRLKASDDGFNFIFGSALSAIKDGAGIPNVAEVSKIIENYADEIGLLEDYKEHINGSDEKDIYQKSFSFMSAVKGATATREIVKRVVMKNYDADTGTHKVPKAIREFVKCIKEQKIKVHNIITTNFDTLIEEQFKKEKIGFNSISIVSDSNIIDNSNGYINIIHLHGVWDKGDTMHTLNQLESKRNKIESSLRNLLVDKPIIIMAYGGWLDSFTRTLANIVNDDKAEYNLAWCFYQNQEGVIEREDKNLFDMLSSAISRDRIQFFKGIDCNCIFSNLISKVEVRKNNSTISSNQVNDEINYYPLAEKAFFKNIREKTKQAATEILNKKKSLFVEARLGFGLYGFISSLVNTIKSKKTKCLKIDFSQVISKSQIDDKVKTDTGHYLASLIFQLSMNSDIVHFVIFDKIRGNVDEETLLHLLKLPEMCSSFGVNIFFIYSSSVNLKQFQEIKVELPELSLRETESILYEEFGTNRFTPGEIHQIHDRSEGVVAKLEQIMYFLESSSAQEVLLQNDIFDESFYFESIPSTTIKQIELLLNDPSKKLTLKMLNILSILKNGETLSNLRKDKMGIDLNPRNTKELIQFELASTIYIDTTTTLIRINPIIKDYVLSKMSLNEKFKISNAYLRVAIIETKEGIKLSSSNRKIYENEYNTEEDNTSTLLKLAIQECKSNLSESEQSDNNLEMNRRKLNKLLHFSRSYIYILSNSSKFSETISSIDSLISVVKDVDTENMYRYYYHMANAYRMKSYTDEAEYFLRICEKNCPDTDKDTLELVFIEKLYLLEKKSLEKAIDFSKNNKLRFHKNSAAYIASEGVIAREKDKGNMIKTLERLEKKARKFGYHTLANNFLFTLNQEKNDIDKIMLLNKVIKTDSSPYNICRATVYKNEVLVRNKSFEKIKDQDINMLRNIYNYLFRQKFDVLFNKCHEILWKIAEHKQNKELILLIFYKGTIVWRLNSDVESENKYKSLLSSVDNLDQVPLLYNKTS